MKGIGAAIFVLVVTLIYIVYVKRQRTDSWKASEVSGDGQSKVELVAGPWPGRIVKVNGIPTAGSELSSWTSGLVGDDVHHGHYVVIDVDPEARKAVASWELNK